MPLAVDTNVLARALVDDGSEQARISRQILSDKDVFIPDTVLLESEWLLRSVMKLDRVRINKMFATLVASDNIAFADRRRIADIVTSHRAGLDFADAMHLHGSDGCSGFASFDADLIKRAKKIAGSIPVVTPQAA